MRRAKDRKRDTVTERRQTPIGALSVVVAHDRDGWAGPQKAMATKGTLSVDSTGSVSLAQVPPQISLTSPLLASVIRLPPDPLIAYAIFEPSAALDPSLHLSTIESARRRLVSDSRSVLKSLLFTVKILPRLPLLYVFAISSSAQRSPPHDALLNLKFDGLVRMYSFLLPSDHPPIILLSQPPPVLFSLSKGSTHAVPLARLLKSLVPTAWPPPLTPLTPNFCHAPSHANFPAPRCEHHTHNYCTVSVILYWIDLGASRALLTHSQRFGVRGGSSLLEQMDSPNGAQDGSTDVKTGLSPHPLALFRTTTLL